MKFAFQHMRLETGSYQSLFTLWVETQLRVTGDAAVIVGDGYSREVAEAFTLLVFDWEATVILPRERIGLAPGEYALIRHGEDLYACRDQRMFLLPDLPAVVEVWVAEEEE